MFKKKKNIGYKDISRKTRINKLYYKLRQSIKYFFKKAK